MKSKILNLGFLETLSPVPKYRVMHPMHNQHLHLLSVESD